jgi:hypothetical protein
METHLDQIQVVSILEQPYAGEAFPGHDQINDTLGVPEVAIKQDWHDWRESLHGNNIALRELVGEKGPDYARANLHFALLEFWSMRTADEDVLARHPAAGQRPAPVTTHPHREAHLVSE